MGAFDFNFDLPADETFAPEPTRVRALQAILPPEPFTLAPDVNHRDQWDPWRDQTIGRRALSAARELAAQPYPDYTDALFARSLDGLDLDAINQAMAAVRNRQTAFLLAELIYDNGEFLPLIATDLAQMAALRTWINPHEDRHRRNFEGKTAEADLCVVHFAENLALTHRLLGPRLSSSTKALIYHELDRRVFAPMRERVTLGRDLTWWLNVKHNWIAVCLSGLTQAAVAILPAEQRAWWVAFAESRVRNFRDSFNDDGCCTEGLGYWSYGFMNFIMLSEVLRYGTGGVIDLLDEPKMRRIVRFADHVEIEPAVFPAYADCGLGVQPTAWVRAWLENRAGSAAPDEQTEPLDTDILAHTGLHLAAESLLWMFRTRDPLHPRRRKPSPALRHWFDGATTLLVCRPGPATKRRFSATLLGGNNGVNHNHNDLGTFTVVLDGRTLVLDPGPEPYTFRTFSEKRYDGQLLNSYGHPVPRVAGRLQEFGADWRTRVITKEFSDDLDRVVLDLRGAYNFPALRKLEREFIYDRRGDGSLTITDQVEFGELATYESALVTLGQVKIAGGTVHISDEAAAIAIDVTVAGGALAISMDTLEQAPQPKRIALGFAALVTTATVRCVIRPA